jgi:phosphoribosyl-AMP cyclohydrolase / phosphoribosyl-ATP pyrophosphohydrolase
MNLKFNQDGLIPAIIQDSANGNVLMLGYMNEEALQLTRETGKVTLWSRSRKEIWEKGETSGNGLQVVDILPDCDNDSLLIRAKPSGPTCHTGSESCFGDFPKKDIGFLNEMENIIAGRAASMNKESYTYRLINSGVNRIAQKLGEEAIETIIAAKDDDEKEFLEESADLIYHLAVLLLSKGMKLADVVEVLRKRNISARR